MNCRQEALRMSLNHVVPVEPNVASNTTVFVQQLWQQLLGHNYVAPALSKKPFYLPSPNKKQCVREERSDMCSLHPRMDIDISACHSTDDIDAFTITCTMSCPTKYVYTTSSYGY
eukprot:536495_1